MQKIYNIFFYLFLIISEINTNIFYIINIIRIKYNFRFAADKTAAIKIIIIIKIITAVTVATAVIKFILFIIRKFIIRYQTQLL